MRKYTVVKTNHIKKLYCNGCGRELQVKNGIIEEGVISVNHQWSYFSDKDGEVHSFDLCEKCYNKLTKSFKIPPTIKHEKELV